MRGKAVFGALMLIGIRITPAYAGKSQSTIVRFTEFQDHPRLCGEKRGQKLNHLPPIGSPPPMRGKENDLTIVNTALGITPAYAGKSRQVNCIVP